MSALTHERALEWAARRTGAAIVQTTGPYHLRFENGRRARVAGRHVEQRRPKFFHLGSTLRGDPFDELIVVMFDRDWTVEYAYQLSFEAVLRMHTQPGAQGCRLLTTRTDSWGKALPSGVARLAP
jgi:hypothetical protein